jgi:hypothetical protein
LDDQRRASSSRSLNRPFRFVAVIKGLPLKIKPLDAPYEGDQSVGGPVGTPAHCRYKRGPITRVLSWRRQRAGCAAFAK